MPDVQVGTRRIETGFDPKRTPLAQAREKLLALNEVDDAACELDELLVGAQHVSEIGSLARCGDGSASLVEARQSPSSSSPPVMAVWRLLLTNSFNSLPTLKKGSRLAGTGTGCPVRGLRPSYGL